MEPPVIVSPLVEEIPVVVTPWRVEEAVVEVAKKLVADTPPANVPAPWTLKREEGEVVPRESWPLPFIENIGEVVP